MRPVVVGTAGHVDHGKTLLVKALTGVDADRWEEEKRRGITLDIGFAPLREGDRDLHFVDLPGHERFVKNMLAGASGVDLFLLVVAADESVMPQTEEHADILRLLGLSRGVVALNKTDLADAETLEMARLEVGEFLDRAGLSHLPVVPVSALTGNGLPELRAALLEQAAACPARPADRPFRLPVDRVFSVRGFGTVVTGTCTDGTVAVEERVEVFPAGGESKVRGIQVFAREVQAVSAGQRAALNLPDLKHQELHRGQVAAAPGAIWPSSMLDVRGEVLPSAAVPLRDGMTVRLHLHTQEAEAHLHLCGTRTLAAGERGLCQLRLPEPACAWPGDRFILRLPSPVRTVAGGEVLLVARRRARWGRPRDAAIEETLRENGLGAGLEALLCEAGPQGCRPPEAAARLGRSGAALAALASEAEEAGTLVRWPGADWWLHGPQAEAWLDRAEAFLRGRAAAGSPWVPRPELCSRWGRILEAHQAEALADALVAAGRAEREGDRLRPPGHRLELTRAERAIWDALLAEFAAAGLSPRTGDELVRLHGSAARKVLPLLVQEGRLMRFSGDFFIRPEALERVREALSERARAGAGLLTVPEFKALLGVTRRYAMPLLELLDDRKWTRREGDGRRILV